MWEKEQKLLREAWKNTMDYRQDQLDALVALTGGKLSKKYRDEYKQMTFEDWVAENYEDEKPKPKKKKRKLVIKKPEKTREQIFMEEKEDVEVALEVCMGEVDPIFYQENLDWSFEKPGDIPYETLYIYKRGYNDNVEKEEVKPEVDMITLLEEKNKKIKELEQIIENNNNTFKWILANVDHPFITGLNCFVEE